MRRSLLTIALLFALSACDLAIGSNDDAQSFLEPEMIKGVWVAVTERPSHIQGLYEKDTIQYRIGVDPVPQTRPKYLERPMAFFVVYERGASYGFIHEPEEEYDWDEELSMLQYQLVEGLPGPTTHTLVSFSMPETDSLNIRLGGRIFGTRRLR